MVLKSGWLNPSSTISFLAELYNDDHSGVARMANILFSHSINCSRVVALDYEKVFFFCVFCSAFCSWLVHAVRILFVCAWVAEMSSLKRSGSIACCVFVGAGGGEGGTDCSIICCWRILFCTWSSWFSFAISVMEVCMQFSWFWRDVKIGPDVGTLLEAVGASIWDYDGGW